MFTDVVGSTALSTEQGDERALEKIARSSRLVREAVIEHGGREVKSLGDGSLCEHGPGTRAAAKSDPAAAPEPGPAPADPGISSTGVAERNSSRWPGRAIRRKRLRMAGFGEVTRPDVADAVLHPIQEERCARRRRCPPTLTTEPGPIGRLWGRCFAALYGPLLWRTERRGNAARRAHLLRHAEGTVVEIGAGSGHNLSHTRTTSICS